MPVRGSEHMVGMVEEVWFPDRKLLVLHFQLDKLVAQLLTLTYTCRHFACDVDDYQDVQRVHGCLHGA